MGRQDVEQTTYTSSDRRAHRERLRSGLAALRALLETDRFETDRDRMGLEIELNLADASGAPFLGNDRVLALIDSAEFVPELGRFTIEANVPPRDVGGYAFHALEDDLCRRLDDASSRVGQLGGQLVTIGILPTLSEQAITSQAITANPRYHMLERQLLAARGEDLELDISGPHEHLVRHLDTIAAEAACTSVQFHLQVAPENFAAVWNSSQAVAGVQLALGANSPFFLHRELWRETRTVLFEQATDTRTEELRAQGVRPRVWFGERWIGSVVDLFEENLRYFPPLLAEVDDEDPGRVLEAGGVPSLAELRLHNGTIYRWNRPVYDVPGGVPHLRVENRVLPAGPSVLDVVANAAFYYGLVRGLAESSAPVWQELPFEVAADNFVTGARDGIEAVQRWPGRDGLRELPASELVLRELLPLAHIGLERWGIDAGERDRYLGVIEARAAGRVNGASWQVAAVRALEDAGHSRPDALAAMTRRYVEHAAANAPVHTWPVL